MRVTDDSHDARYTLVEPGDQCPYCEGIAILPGGGCINARGVWEDDFHCLDCGETFAVTADGRYSEEES